MDENTITKLVLLGVSNMNCRLFRNNTGMGWQGENQRTTQGDILIKSPRPLHAGLCKGSSDLIGWTSVEITPQMVGKKVAVFTAVEVKMPNGRASSEQLNFIDQIRLSGGIAGIARSPEEAQRLIEHFSKI